MRVVNNRRWNELHFPAALRHAVRQFDILGASDREARIVSVHFQETLTTEGRGVGVYKIDLGKIRHQAIAILVVGLNKTRDKGLLTGPVSALYAHHAWILERRGHCSQPVAAWHAVVIGEENDGSLRCQGSPISCCCGPSVHLTDKAHTRIA